MLDFFVITKLGALLLATIVAMMAILIIMAARPTLGWREPFVIFSTSREWHHTVLECKRLLIICLCMGIFYVVNVSCIVFKNAKKRAPDGSLVCYGLT